VFNARTRRSGSQQETFRDFKPLFGRSFLANQNESLTPFGSADRQEGSGICCKPGSTIDPAILLHCALCSSQLIVPKKNGLTSTSESCHSVRQESPPIAIPRSLSE
jgi:hypothetical protein